MQVKTGSMEKAIYVDDIVIEKILKKSDEIVENDIITYKKDGLLITHRVKKIKNDEIITKGDANNSEDEPISKDNVIGKTIIVIHDIAIWKKVFTTKNVYIPMIITVILFMITFLIKDKETEDINEKKE